MSTLLHICCAPCSVACVRSLREDGISLVGYWNNPNIHPTTEYRKRHGTLIDYARSINLPLIDEGFYGLRTFLDGLHGDYDHRCGFCYRSRLEPTVQKAVEKGFDSFSTTLLISPYQQHDLLRQVGEELSEQYGIPFLYRDFRPLFRQGQEEARSLGLYMQKYCGCIFSEEDRYCRRKKTNINEEASQ